MYVRNHKLRQDISLKVVINLLELVIGKMLMYKAKTFKNCKWTFHQTSYIKILR